MTLQVKLQSQRNVLSVPVHAIGSYSERIRCWRLSPFRKSVQSLFKVAHSFVLLYTFLLRDKQEVITISFSSKFRVWIIISSIFRRKKRKRKLLVAIGNENHCYAPRGAVQLSVPDLRKVSMSSKPFKIYIETTIKSVRMFIVSTQPSRLYRQSSSFS